MVWGMRKWAACGYADTPIEAELLGMFCKQTGLSSRLASVRWFAETAAKGRRCI